MNFTPELHRWLDSLPKADKKRETRIAKENLRRITDHLTQGQK